MDQSAPRAAAGPRPRPTLPVELAALAGALVGLAPGAAAAWAGLALALAATLALIIATRRGTVAPALARLAIAAAMLTALVAAFELRATPSAPEALERAARTIEQRWQRLVGRLDAALTDTPPPGGDYAWVAQRREALGEGAGYAVLSADDLQPVFWSGWTTPLEGSGVGELLAGTADRPLLFVLRRGLALRLALARR
ncbi:MAG: hypothetical protein D6738_06765, partial [Acidobacteria bacterium]